MESLTSLEAGTNTAAETLDILKQTLAAQKSQSRHSLIAMLCSILTFLLLTVAAVIVIPPVMKAVSTVNTQASKLESVTEQIGSLATQVSNEVSQIDTIVTKAKWEMDEISTMVTSITKASQNLDKLVTDNTTAISESVEKISQIDFETLNKAIADLAVSVEPLANFARLFQRQGG